MKVLKQFPNRLTKLQPLYQRTGAAHAARIGCPVYMAMSRPTTRAVEAANFYNITLIDMARRSNRIYSHVRRIEGF